MENFYSFCIYLLFFLTSFSLYNVFKYYINKKKIVGFKKNIILFLSMMPLIILFSFRDNVGTDYGTYVGYYYQLGNTPISFRSVFLNFIEPLWFLITHVFYYLKIPFWGFLILISSIFAWFEILILEKFDDKYSNFICQLLIYITLFTLFMNTTRQQLACIIILYSLFAFLEKKYIKFILLILFASLFHSTSLIVVIILPAIYYITKNKILSRIFKIMMFTSPCWAFMLGNIFNAILSFLSPDNVYINDGNGIKLGYLLYTIPNFLILFYLYFCNKKEKNNIFDNELQLLFNVYLLQLFCQSAGSFFLPIERMGLYFSCFQILLFATATKKSKHQINITILLSIWYLIYYIIMFIVLRGNGIYPYNFLWS